MKKFIPYIFLLTLFIGTSCQQDTSSDLGSPETISDTPIFTFSANDGEYSIQAGVQNFYMFSEFELDQTETYNFIGRLSKLSTCVNNCDEELIIRIKYFEVVATSSDISIDESISPGIYSFGDVSSLSFNEISIEYTDKDGETFSTNSVDQDVESSFEIVSVSDFDQNENNQPTKKLEIKFNCILGHVDSNFSNINFENAEAVIAIAYPD